MSHPNHTPIDILKFKKPHQTVSLPKESEPLAGSLKPIESTEAVEQKTAPEESVQTETQESVTEEKAPEGELQEVEDRPEEVELDQELKSAGVQNSHHQSFFANNKEVHLPIPIEEVDKGMQLPLTSGLRWVAEITMYVLAKFHKTIKRIGGMLQIVEKE